MAREILVEMVVRVVVSTKEGLGMVVVVAGTTEVGVVAILGQVVAV